MKNLFIALIALPAMGCNLDKDSGTEVAGLSCTETPDELSIEEESPLGFAWRDPATLLSVDSDRQARHWRVADRAVVRRYRQDHDLYGQR